MKRFAYAFTVDKDRMLEIGFVDKDTRQDGTGVMFFRDMDTQEIILTANIYPLEAKKLREYLFGKDGD